MTSVFLPCVMTNGEKLFFAKSRPKTGLHLIPHLPLLNELWNMYPAWTDTNTSGGKPYAQTEGKYPVRTIQIFGSGQQLSLNMKVFRTSYQQNLPEKLLILMQEKKLRTYISTSSLILLGPISTKYLLRLTLLKNERPAKCSNMNYNAHFIPTKVNSIKTQTTSSA